MKTTTMQTAKIFLIFHSIFMILNRVKTTKVDYCVLGNGTLPQEVDLEGCDIPPCIVYIETNCTMTMKFRSPRYLEYFAPKATALALGATVPYPLGQADGCLGVTNTPCPLAENEYIEYTYSMFIYSFFPKISFVLEFSLVDLEQNEEQLECFRVGISLADSP